MAKIPFDVQYRPQIESGEYKVEIGKSDPWPARISCWDLNGNDLIVIVSNPEGKEEGLIYTPEGKHKAYAPKIDSDLFLVTPEPELSEFEKAFYKYAFEYIDNKEDDDIECCKRYAAELQKLAIEKYGPLYTKKEHELAEEAFNKGKAEALKDMPRWSRVSSEVSALTYTTRNDLFLFHKGYGILLSDLEKLPGFNED